MSETETTTAEQVLGDIQEGVTRPLAEFHGKPRIPADSILVRASSETTGIALLIEKAIESGRDVRELVDAFKEALAIQARQQFASAMHAFRAECPPIPKARWAEMTGRNSDYAWGFSYAPLDVIDEVTRPILGRHGLSYRFVQEKPEGGLIPVVCVVRHVGGHEERTPYWAAMGTNDKISQAQNMAAGNTFAKRQALVAALGLVTTDNFDNEEALALLRGVNGPAPAKAVRESIQPPRRRADAPPPQRASEPARESRKATTFVPAAGPGMASDAQVRMIKGRADRAGISEAELARRFELETIDQIPRGKVDAILDYLANLAG